MQPLDASLGHFSAQPQLGLSFQLVLTKSNYVWPPLTMQQTSDLGDPTSTCPPWSFLKMGDPKLSSPFLILRDPEKAHKGVVFACNAAYEYLYTIPLVAWTLPWLKNMAGKCVFAVPRCPSLNVTIHNLPHFRVSSKHVAGSMCLTLMLCRCLSRFGPKRGS